eukprot:5403946-Amphidinium_carterae.1
MVLSRVCVQDAKLDHRRFEVHGRSKSDGKTQACSKSGALCRSFQRGNTSQPLKVNVPKPLEQDAAGPLPMSTRSAAVENTTARGKLRLLQSLFGENQSTKVRGTE